MNIIILMHLKNKKLELRDANMPKITQLISGRAKTGTQIGYQCPFSSLHSLCRPDDKTTHSRKAEERAVPQSFRCK